MNSSAYSRSSLRKLFYHQNMSRRRLRRGRLADCCGIAFAPKKKYCAFPYFVKEKCVFFAALDFGITARPPRDGKIQIHLGVYERYRAWACGHTHTWLSALPHPAQVGCFKIRFVRFGALFSPLSSSFAKLSPELCLHFVDYNEPSFFSLFWWTSL